MLLFPQSILLSGQDLVWSLNSDALFTQVLDDANKHSSIIVARGVFAREELLSGITL